MLGAAAIVPLVSARVVAPARARVDAARERWRRVAVQAAKQCGRAVVPSHRRAADVRRAAARRLVRRARDAGRAGDRRGAPAAPSAIPSDRGDGAPGSRAARARPDRARRRMDERRGAGRPSPGAFACCGWVRGRSEPRPRRPSHSPRCGRDGAGEQGRPTQSVFMISIDASKTDARSISAAVTAAFLVVHEAADDQVTAGGRRRERARRASRVRARRSGSRARRRTARRGRAAS